MTYNDRIESFPPILCRILAARKVGMTGRRPLTTLEVCNKSGLVIPVVQQMSLMTRWDNVTVKDMRLFLHGCGLDFSDAHSMRRLDDYMQSNPTLAYLRRDAQWKHYWLPLLVEWARSQTNETAAALQPAVRSLWARINKAVA